MKEMMDKKEIIRLIVGGTIIWGFFGFAMTISSFTYQYPPNLSPNDLSLQINTFDKQILLKSIIIFASIGVIVMFVLSYLYYKSPPLIATRNTFIYAMIISIMFSSISAFWYFPSLDLIGTHAILHPIHFRIFIYSLFGILAASAACGFFMRIPFPPNLSFDILRCEVCGIRLQKIDNSRGYIMLAPDEAMSGVSPAEECQECGRVYCGNCYPFRPNICVCGRGKGSIKSNDGVVYRGSLRLIKVRYFD